MNTYLKSGFTVVELVIVITVIAILAGLVFVGYGAWYSQSVDRAVESDVYQASLQARSLRNFSDTNDYPDTASFSYDSSPEVNISYTQLSSGSDYCVSGSGVSVGGVEYHMDSTDSEPQSGASC